MEGTAFHAAKETAPSSPRLRQQDRRCSALRFGTTCVCGLRFHSFRNSVGSGLPSRIIFFRRLRAFVFMINPPHTYSSWLSLLYDIFNNFACDSARAISKSTVRMQRKSGRRLRSQTSAQAPVPSFSGRIADIGAAEMAGIRNSAQPGGQIAVQQTLQL